MVHVFLDEVDPFPDQEKFKTILMQIVGGCQARCIIGDVEMENGRFQKISIPYQGRLLRIPRVRGGSLNWNSEGMGGILTSGILKVWGVSDLGFPEGTDK